MSWQPRADVIVRADREPTTVECCVRSLLEHSGEALHRLILIEDGATERQRAAWLKALGRLDPRIHVLQNPDTPGMVSDYNFGLRSREGDAVLFGSDCVAGPGWLLELAEVAHSEERTACVSPLVNEVGAFFVDQVPGEPIENMMARVRSACAGLPRSSVAYSAAQACVYVRGNVVDSAGVLDRRLGSFESSMADWIGRVSALGFEAKRANRVYIHRTCFGSVTRRDGSAHREGDDTAPGASSLLEHERERFCRSLDGQMAAHAVCAAATGKLRVALDIRHVPPEQVGTRTYTLSLAQALGELSEIELTLLVRDPAQANGLTGRVVTVEHWADDVAVIHKPAQVVDPRDLRLLFGSSAHVVISYLDLIGYRVPASFPTNAAYDLYRMTSSLSIQAAQRIVAISECAAGEIAAEFGISRDELGVVHLGVDACRFSERGDHDGEVDRQLRLDRPYFFSIATDFPHKNLANLLEAYAILRKRWREGRPPDLILAGHTSSSRTEFYHGLESKALPDGVSFLGPISAQRLRILYQHALALVFPSLYEGFGLPLLEAMAAGTPVVAMPISAVPEVAGEAVVYADGFSPSALARAMESVAGDEGLRDDLRDRGRKHALQYTWEKTARATVEIYRSAIFRPSLRSIQMRRQLRDAINLLAEPRATEAWLETYDDWSLVAKTQPLGIRNAIKALNVSVQYRLRRELRRIRAGTGRRSA